MCNLSLSLSPSLSFLLCVSLACACAHALQSAHNTLMVYWTNHIRRCWLLNITNNSDKKKTHARFHSSIFIYLISQYLYSMAS